MPATLPPTRSSPVYHKHGIPIPRSGSARKRRSKGPRDEAIDVQTLHRAFEVLERRLGAVEKRVVEPLGRPYAQLREQQTGSWSSTQGRHNSRRQDSPDNPETVSEASSPPTSAGANAAERQGHGAQDSAVGSMPLEHEEVHSTDGGTSYPVMDSYGVQIQVLRSIAKRDEAGAYRSNNQRSGGSDGGPLVYTDGEDPEEVEIEAHLSRHRRRVQVLRAAVMIQSTWRMFVAFQAYRRHTGRGRNLVAAHFHAWRTSYVADRMWRHSLLRRSMKELHEYADWQVRIRTVANRVFQKSASSGKLTVQVVNLFFLHHTGKGRVQRLAIDDIWVSGVLRNILTVIVRGWGLEVRRLKTNRLQAAVHLVKAQRLSATGQNTWMSEKVFVLFHLWRRMVAFKKALYSGQRPFPTFGEPHLSEWETWVFDDTKRRVIKSKLSVLGGELLERWVMDRWKGYMAYQRMESFRELEAAEHYCGSLIRKCMMAWDALARERGRVLRSRIKYLTAWKKWTPVHKRLAKCKAAVRERARILRLRALLRTWQKQILTLHQLEAFRVDFLTDRYCHQTYLAIGYTWTEMPTHFTALRCWREWRDVTKRSIRWRRFSFFQRKMYAENLMRLVLRAWHMVSGEKHKDVDKLTIEPVGSVDRLLAIESKVGRGFLPESILTKTELTRLLCPNIDGKDTSTVKAPEQGPEVDRLITAVGERCEATVSNLLTSGVAVNGVASDGTGRTALHVACSQISPEILPIIAQLLGAGALLTMRDAEERLPLDVTVNPQIASMLHLHKQRLWAGEFTKEEKRRSVDILNELWGTMGSRSLWRYVTLGLIRHRMTTTQKQVKYLQLPYELTLNEWKEYRKFNARHPRYGEEPDDFEYLRSGSSLETGIRSRSPRHSRHGTRDDLMRQQSSISQLHPLQSQPSHVSETYSQQPISSRSGTTDGDISSVAGHHTAASFNQGGHDHGVFKETYMNAELREQLWGLFPLFEQNQRFVRLLSLLDRAQPSADRFMVLDKELLVAWGIDLNRDEVDGTRFRLSFKPDTCLIEAPGLNPGHTRRLDLKRTADVREVCPTVEERSIVRRSEVWFEAWCNRNADLLAAIPSSPKAQQPQSARKDAAPANAAQGDTVKLKALMVCRHAMERKSNRVLEGRRGVLKRDRFLLEGVLGRISDAHEARAEGEGLVGSAALVEEPSQPPQEVKSPGRPSPMTSSRRTRAQFYPLTIDVVPYLHKDTYDLSVSMRPPVRAPSHMKAIAFVVSNVTSAFWSQAIRPYDDFDADYSSVVAYLPAHWAKEDRIMDILRSHYRVLKQDEVTLSRDYKALTAELAKLTKTLRDANAVEDMAAVHVVQQAAYMKEKVRKVKGKLYSAIKGLNRRHEELDTVRLDLAQAETELQRVTSAFSLLCGDSVTALSAKDASELRVPKDMTPRSKTKWRKLSQTFTERSDRVKELRDYLVIVHDEIEAGKQRVASTTIENATTSTQLKQLLKESLMFIHQAGTMRSMYRDERRSMVTRAKQLLHSLNCTRAKLYDVLTLFQEIKALVAARSAIQRMAGPTDELALDRDSEVSFVDAELEAACLEQLEKEEEEEAAEHKRSKKGQRKAARRAKGRKAKAKSKARTSEQSLSEAATVEETESEVEDDSIVKESQDGVRDDDEAVEHGQTHEAHGPPKRPPAIVTVVPMGKDDSAHGPAEAHVLAAEPTDDVASHTALLEASYRKRGDVEKRKMEEALRLLGLTFDGDVRELAKPQPQSSLAAVVEEARSKIVAERIEKTSAPSSSNTSVSSSRVISFGRTVRLPQYDAETLYEDALQKLFFDERQQYYEAKDQEVQDAAEREAEEQIKHATGGFSDEDIEVLLTEEDEDRPVTPTEDEADAVGPVVSSKKPSAFMRIWDRVRRQKMLLFKVNPAQEDNERAEKAITDDARCTMYEFANMGVALQSPRAEAPGPQDEGYGGVPLLSEEPTAAKPEDGDESSGLWADGAPIMASISMKKPTPAPAQPARSTATSAKGVTSPKGRAARAEAQPAQATRSSLNRYFFSNFELTNALLAQKRLVRNMDEKELAPLKGDEDFMRVCSTYALSFGVDNDSVFQSSGPSPRMPVPIISSPVARDRSMRGSPTSPSLRQSGTGSPVRAVFVSATSPTRSSYSIHEPPTSSVTSSRAAEALLKNMTVHSPASAAIPTPTGTGTPASSPPPSHNGSFKDKGKKSPGSPTAEQRPRSRSPSPTRQRQQVASPSRERQDVEEPQLPAQDQQPPYEEMGQKQHDDTLQSPKKTEHKAASPKKEPSQRTPSPMKPQVKSPDSSPPRPAAPRTKQKKKKLQQQAQQKPSQKRSQQAGKGAPSGTRPPSLSTVPDTQPRRPSFEWSEGPSSPIIHAIIEGDEDEDEDGEQDEKVHVYSPGDEEPASPPETASPFPRPRSPPYAWTSPQASAHVHVLGEAELSPPQRAPDDIFMSIDLAILSKPGLVTTAASAPATQSDALSHAHAASTGGASQASEALPSDVQEDDDTTSMASTEAGEEEEAAPHQRETVYHPVVDGAKEMGQHAASRDRGPRPSALLCVGKAPAGLPPSTSSAHGTQGVGRKRKKDMVVDRRRTRHPDLSAFVAFGFTDQPISGSNPYPHAKRHVGRSALRDKHSGMAPEGAPALELVGAEAPATGSHLKSFSSTLTSESMVGPDNIGLAPSSQSSSHIVFTQTSGVSIERARDGLGYSCQYYDSSKSRSHVCETDQGAPPPAVEWSWKEQILRDIPSEPVALETSEQRLKRLQGTRPQLILEGLGYVDPTAEEPEAAPMWTEEMPLLSPSRKEKIWDDFESAPLPKRARSAYQELGSVQNKVDMDGMLDELQMMEDDSHAFMEDLRSCLPPHSPLQHLFDRITEPDDIASIPLDDFSVGTLAPSAFASGPATPPMSSSEDTLGVPMTDECVQEVLNMAASEDILDVGVLKRAREPAAEIVMTLALREMLQDMTQGHQDTPCLTQGRSRSSRLSVRSRVTRPSRRQVVEQNRREMRERVEQEGALQVGHSWSYGHATEAKAHGEHRPKPLLRARPSPTTEAAAATVAPTPSRSSSEAKEDAGPSESTSRASVRSKGSERAAQGAARPSRERAKRSVASGDTSLGSESRGAEAVDDLISCWQAQEDRPLHIDVIDNVTTPEDEVFHGVVRSAEHEHHFQMDAEGQRVSLARMVPVQPSTIEEGGSIAAAGGGGIDNQSISSQSTLGLEGAVKNALQAVSMSQLSVPPPGYSAEGLEGPSIGEMSTVTLTQFPSVLITDPAPLLPVVGLQVRQRETDKVAEGPLAGGGDYGQPLEKSPRQEFGSAEPPVASAREASPLAHPASPAMPMCLDAFSGDRRESVTSQPSTGRSSSASEDIDVDADSAIAAVDDAMRRSMTEAAPTPGQTGHPGSPRRQRAPEPILKVFKFVVKDPKAKRRRPRKAAVTSNAFSDGSAPGKPWTSTEMRKMDEHDLQRKEALLYCEGKQEDNVQEEADGDEDNDDAIWRADAKGLSGAGFGTVDLNRLPVINPAEAYPRVQARFERARREHNMIHNKVVQLPELKKD